MSSLRTRIALTALILGSAGVLGTSNTAAAGSSDGDPICEAVACPGGSRSCADLEIPGAEQCTDPEVMCCVPDEPTYKHCTERTSNLD